MGSPRRFRSRVLALLTIALVAAGIATAQPPRAKEHKHRTAVIVLGKPRPAQRVVVVGGARHGVLDLNVKPKDTEVWLDGSLLGTCDAFDGFPGKLTLPPGLYRIRLVTPNGVDVARDLRVRPGVELNVGLDLR